MTKFEFLKNATIVKETEEETFYKNEEGKFFRIPKSAEELEILKESEDRLLLGKNGMVHCMMSKAPLKELFFGDYMMIPIGYTAEELEKAREEAVEKVCEAIRQFAKETPEMVFVEKDFKDTPDGDVHTVGCKVALLMP